MDHEYWEIRVQGYLDNELSPADRMAVEQHVSSCEDCEYQLEYFSALKERLRVHADNIEMPVSFQNRLEHMFAKKRAPKRRWLVPALAMAAVMTLALLLTFTSRAPMIAVHPGEMIGRLVCHDCEVAARSGYDKGEFCFDGHRLGLITEDNELYRFVAKKEDATFITNMSLAGQKVRVFGDIIEGRKLLRVDRLEDLVSSRAYFSPVNFQHP